MAESSPNGRKHCGKRRNSSLRKTSNADTKKPGLVWEWVKMIIYVLEREENIASKG